MLMRAGGWLGEIFPGERDFGFRGFRGVQFSYSFTRRDMNKCLLRSKTKILLQVPTLGVLRLGQKKGRASEILQRGFFVLQMPTLGIKSRGRIFRVRIFYVWF